MKRPQLVHFLCIVTDHNINIRVSVTLMENPFGQRSSPLSQGEFFENAVPLGGLKLLRACRFKIKLVGLEKSSARLYGEIFESDSFGNFNFKIPLTEKTKNIEALQLYEIGHVPGLEFYLGTFIPLYVRSPKKIVICDFDKTLLETKFSSLKELYRSLTTPLGKFITLENSQKIIKSLIEKGFHPFIVSSSPHFYENAIRDWLYTREIHPAGIFLKDYRKIFSLFDRDLTAKDIKGQGLYKLGQLIDILLMTGIPRELILMGDNFESDPVVYLTLAMILHEDHAPWNIWHHLKKRDSFKLNRKQDTSFLNKIYLLGELIDQFWKDNGELSLKIYIRKKDTEEKVEVDEFFKNRLDFIELYDG